MAASYYDYRAEADIASGRRKQPQHHGTPRVPHESHKNQPTVHNVGALHRLATPPPGPQRPSHDNPHPNRTHHNNHGNGAGSRPARPNQRGRTNYVDLLPAFMGNPISGTTPAAPTVPTTTRDVRNREAYLRLLLSLAGTPYDPTQRLYNL